MLTSNRMDKKELSATEAKKNFISAMDELTLRNIIKDTPFQSVAVACTAGAMLGSGASKIRFAVKSATELLYLYHDFAKLK